LEKTRNKKMHKIIPYRIAKDQLSIHEKVGQFFMPAAFINDTESEIQQLEILLKKYHVGGICFFHSRASAATNYEGKKEVVYNEKSLETLKKRIQRYQACVTYPLLISIDAEWGLAMRIEETPQYPYAITLGAMHEQEKVIYEVGKQIAKDCLNSGIHWNFAPVVDVNSNPNNPVIGYRSFGSDKEKVIANAKAFLKGAQSEGILSCIKHFPGHGDTATDSHLGLPIINKSKSDIYANEIAAFKALIDEGVEAVMVGHLAVPALTKQQHIPATISAEIIKGILRTDLGFKGLVVSDALNMHSVSKLFAGDGSLEWEAFNAGNDILCFAENVSQGVTKILENASENQIEESFKRVWELKERVIGISTEGDPIDPQPIHKKVASESLTLLKGDQNTISQFRTNTFVGITIGTNGTSTFLDSVSEDIDFPKYQLSEENLTLIREKTRSVDHILIALYPPQIKPNGNFGLSEKEILFINHLSRYKKIALYLFGNPYATKHLPVNFLENIVIGYQNFEEFQFHAANHFLGKVSAKGKLPVSII